MNINTALAKDTWETICDNSSIEELSILKSVNKELHEIAFQPHRNLRLYLIQPIVHKNLNTLSRFLKTRTLLYTHSNGLLDLRKGNILRGMKYMTERLWRCGEYIKVINIIEKTLSESYEIVKNSMETKNSIQFLKDNDFYWIDLTQKIAKEMSLMNYCPPEIPSEVYRKIQCLKKTILKPNIYQLQQYQL